LTEILYRVSAPGKIILSGEHAVVYGYPALAAAIDRRLTMNSKLEVESEIPIGCGMGSSAAYSVALAAVKMKLKGELLIKAKISRDAVKIEKQFHYDSSGVDTTTSTYGGFIWFRKTTNQQKSHIQIEVKNRLPKLILVNTGRPKESTREMVMMVSERFKKEPKRTGSIMREIEKISTAFLHYLTVNNSINLSDLIKQNERYLEELSVVSDATKFLLREIENIGGAGKICGAGGKLEDSGLVLIYHPDDNKIASFLKKQNIKFSYANLGETGVRMEK
jgi:mevalonate kinase